MSAPELTQDEAAWTLEDVAALAVEANAGLPLPLCDWTDDERAVVKRFEATEAAPESWVPPVTFDPSGDGTHDVRCCDCKARVPSDAAHVVKASNVSGRANRCGPCGQAAHENIYRFNTRCLS